ncbi:MAG: serine/threonine-protein kinase [Pseudanabaena sp. ELA607]|jgi:serine/threonine-protein kinase
MLQPPLANNFLLQNRFRIIQILGQGGFGRTYLALDEQRFNEQCAIKEYIPIQGNAYALEKSKELFQREAETLYQIQHPQIPQFRALFEENARLFFVQDFVQGITYSHLLQDRLTQGEPFSEMEVLIFLNQLLPVLSYIHGRNLIHRDISPDNIILRYSDRLPVLIDFGVVKLTELGQSLTTQGTVVGKSGYSPIEQLKTGKAYPSSDLYALAVTALVLLTGKQPEALFDEMTVSWCWSKYLPNLNPRLAKILEQMLSDRPQQRYQSADEVLTVLTPLLNVYNLATNPTTIITALPNPRSLPMIPPTPTFAVQSRGNISSSLQSGTRANIKPTKVDIQKSRANQFSLWIVAIALTVIIGAIAILIFSITTKKSTARSTITTSQNIEDIENLPLNENTPLKVSGQIGANAIKRYKIEGERGKGIDLVMLSGKVNNISIVHPDGTTPPNLPNIAEKRKYFFPYAGVFTIEIKSNEETNFIFEIVLVKGTAPEKPSGESRPPEPPTGGSRPR